MIPYRFLFSNVTGAARSRHTLPVSALLLIAAAAIHPARADGNPTPGMDSGPFPITVEIVPGVVVVSPDKDGKAAASVTIKGRTLVFGKEDVPVRIVVESQDARVRQELQSSVDRGTSEYGNSEFAPLEPGEYTVTVTAPDGHGTATAQFTAVAPTELGDHAAQVLTQTDAIVAHALEVVTRKIDEKPASPARTKAQEKMAQAASAHNGLTQADASAAMREFAEGFGWAFDALTKKAAESEREKQEALKRLQEAANEISMIEARSAQLKRMSAELDGMDFACAGLAMTVEVAKLGGFILSLEGNLFRETEALEKQAMGWSRDVVADSVANTGKNVAGAGGGLAGGFLAKNYEKLKSLEDLSENSKGILADFTAFGFEQLFNHYCQQFVGPVEATFTGKFFRDVRGVATQWWTQEYKLSGRAVLQYPRDAKGDHITMSGRLEGYAHSFESSDIGLKAFDEKGIMSGAIVAKLRFPPMDVTGAAGAKLMSQGNGPISAQVWGSAVGLAIPNSFLMNVRGELSNDTLTLTIGDRIKDFTAEDDVVAVIVSPLSVGTGQATTWYSLPYVDAHSVFAGGVEEPLDLHLKTVGDSVVAEGSVHHVVNTEHARGEYQLNFKVCNPGC